MIGNHKDDEERDTDAKAPTDELFLDRQERFGFDFAELIAKIRFRHAVYPFDLSAGEWWLDAAEEEPRDQKPDPNNKAEQAHQIDCGELADPFLPELAEIREDAD
jgi:hypothetical protein